ncbi:MAG: hypothetical protein P1V81_02020 [Planctomycetota bacterium]|nr:hypothetical protein [Planctomycetota bacterium]
MHLITELTRLLAILPLAFAPALAQVDEPAPEAPAAEAPAEAPAVPTFEPLPEGIAARAGDVLVPMETLDELLLTRHGKRAEGLDVLNRLLTNAVLREVSAAKGVAISSEQLNARIALLDKRLRESGIEGGLASQLEVGDVNPDVFRETLALAMALEELTRLALGLPEGEEPTPGQQNTWMDELLKSRGIEAFMDPFPEDRSAVVATAGETVVTMEQFYERLRHELPRPMIEQACSQLVLLGTLRRMAGPVDEVEWKAAVDAELGARRAKHMADPEKQGISYEALLEAQGLSLAVMAQDPSVEVTALTIVIAKRQALEAAPAELADAPIEERIDAGLRSLYEADKETYDGYFGERLFLRVCLQRASETPNELVSKTVEQSMAFFERLVPGIPDEEGFIAIVQQLADDPAMKKTGGELGWFGKGDERLPKNLRLLAFDHWATEGAPGVAGPIQVTGGVAILWVGAHQPAPEWAEMSRFVLREQQSGVLGDATPKAGIQIYLDPPPRFAEPEAAAETEAPPQPAPAEGQ